MLKDQAFKEAQIKANKHKINWIVYRDMIVDIPDNYETCSADMWKRMNGMSPESTLISIIYPL